MGSPSQEPDFGDEEEIGEVAGAVPGAATEPHDSKGFMQGKAFTAPAMGNEPEPTRANPDQPEPALTVSQIMGTPDAVLAEKIREARLKGYEGDPCGNCGAFTLVRNGVCLKCNSCGETSGCS